MKAKQLFYLSTIALAISITSCKKDDPEPTNNILPTTFTNGVFITNEGQFGAGTGTVSFYSRTYSTSINNVFELKNGYPLGNIVQSMEIYNGKGYIVVNNAGKVEVVDGTTLASNGVINGLSNPRYFLGINANKGYISQWVSAGAPGEVKVIDLNTKSVTGSITTGKGAESMVLVNNKVYVACSGGYDNDSVVTVIDALTNSVITNINVGANPKNIRVDANGKIWVLCMGQWDAGFTMLVKTGSLVRIDEGSNSVDLTLPFSSTFSQPTNLVINKSKTILYYCYNGSVYPQDFNSSFLSPALITRNFYSLGIDPVTGYIYGGDPIDYSSNGRVIRYKTSGMVLDSFPVGVIPGNFCFK